MAVSTKKRTVSKPIPSAVDGKDWKIRESIMGTGSVDFKSGTVSVPLTADPDGRMTRNHEMLHVKFSPKSPPKLPDDVDPMIYQACEDYRINYRGESLGIVQDAPRLTADDVEKWSRGWKDKPIVAATALVAAATNDKDHAALWDRINKDFDENDQHRIRFAAGNAMHEIYRRRNPGPKTAITAAQMLSDALTPPPPAPKEAGAGDGKSGPDGAEIAKDVKEGIDSLAETYGPGVKKKMLSEKYRHGGIPNVIREFGGFGTMRIRRMPRPLLFPARMKSRRWKPTDQGSVFRYPQRWASDMSGFAFKGIKEGGCTLLIDVSGSMHLDESQILQIMQMMPASLIATYSGRSDSGELRIIAEKGRRAVESDFRYAGGNVIDGPALRWLAKQQGPRYWVSDGHVTGVGDMSRENLVAECLLICERHYIARIHSVDDVIAKFKKFRSK